MHEPRSFDHYASLSRHVPWVRRLARSLVSDEHHADDLAQDACAAALERPIPPLDLRSWLGAVTTRLAARERRRALRAERRERLAARAERVPSTADLVAEISIRESVVRAVLTLEEPHLSAVLLRYYEGLSSRAAAHRLGITEEAMRARLSRGLKRLRSKLEAEHDRPCRGFLAPMLWQVSSSMPGATGSYALGGLLMGMKAGAVLVTVSLLAVLAWWMRVPVHEEGPSAPVGISVESHGETRDTTSGVRRETLAGPQRRTERGDEGSSREGSITTVTRFAVRVVDASGNALPGVRLVIRGRRRDASDETITTLSEVRTDGAGMATVPDLVAQCEAFRGQGSEGRDAAEDTHPCVFSLAPHELGLTEPEIPFDPWSLDGEPLVLKLSSFGRVRVHLANVPPPLDALDYQVSLRGLPASLPETSRSWAARESFSGTVTEGAIYYPYVGLAQLLRVDVRRADEGAPTTLQEFRGPGLDGEEVDVVVHLREPYPAIVGRLLIPDGTPQRNVRVRARIRLEHEHHLVQVAGVHVFPRGPTPRMIQTDREGRFRVPIDQDVTRERRAWLHLELRSEEDPQASFANEVAVWELPAPLGPGEIDAGDLVVRPEPIVAAGWVKDERGEPLAGAKVVLSVQVERPQWGDVIWHALDERSGLSDAQGRFLITGFLEAERVQLHASLEGRVAGEDPVVDKGQSNLLLVLRRESRIEGRLLLPEGLLPEDVEVRVFDRTGGRANVTPDAKGKFTCRGLNPGRHDLEVRPPHSVWVLEVIPDIDVPPGSAATDERLSAIDLRNTWRCVQLRLLDAERNALGHRAALISDPLGTTKEPTRLVRTDEHGRLRALVERSRASIGVSVGRHRRAVILCQEGEQELVLLPALTVRLLLDEDTRVALQSERLEVRLEEVGDGGATAFGTLQVDGTLLFEVASPGDHVVTWGILEREGTLRASRTLAVEHPQKVVVPPDANGHQIGVIMPEEVRAALKH